MKLFIERLKVMAPALLVLVVVAVIVTAGYGLSVLFPKVYAVIALLLLVSLLISVLIDVFKFINWLIIEPFFTKKGVDRK